jgi:hypothetical protein
MHAAYEQLLILLSTPFYVVIIGLEVLLSNYHHRRLYSWKDSLVNVYLMLLNSSMDLLFRGFYIALLTYCYQHRYLEWQNVVMYWALLLLVKILYYWLHRFDHEIRLFWAVHVASFSDLMNFTVDFAPPCFKHSIVLFNFHWPYGIQTPRYRIHVFLHRSGNLCAYRIDSKMSFLDTVVTPSTTGCIILQPKIFGQKPWNVPDHLG